jgi:tricorn protease
MTITCFQVKMQTWEIIAIFIFKILAMKSINFLLSCCFIFQLTFGQEEARLLRFPAVHGNQVVFSYAGDLYTVDRTGGIARKLTGNQGYEMFAHFSPDGKTIAFTGQYDGNTEVFTIPSSGGEPQRLTYTATLGRDDVADRMGPNNIVMTWTPDGKNIIYRSRRYSFNAFRGQLFSVPANGGLSAEIPLVNGGFCTYSPDGRKLAFNRVFREFRTWKYYKGGMADDIWIYDFDTRSVTNATQHDAQDIFPMWHGNEIYFLSDRDRIMNLFVYNTDTKETSKITDFTDYDIKFPSLGDDAIAFEKGGFLYLYEFKTKAVTKVPVQISNDVAAARNAWVDASKRIRSFDISPDGERLVLGARGDIFSLPAKEGITRNITRSTGVHERNGVWSPDGKYIAYLSDQSGEVEIYIQLQDGSEAPVQLTKNADTYKFDIIWSPDSKKILWNDKKFRLQYVDISSKEVNLVDQSGFWEIDDFNWSPDSKWITYSRPERETMSKIILFNTQNKTKTEITDGWYESNNPVFSQDGKYLLFTSARTFDPTYSNTEWNHAYVNMNKIYMVVLARATKSPFAPEDNEVKIVETETAADKAATDKKEETAKAVAVTVDLDGIQNRVVEVPVTASNYRSLACVGSKIYYVERKDDDRKPSLKMYDLENKEEKELGTGMNFIISSNGKKMLVRKDETYAVIDLPVAPIELKKTVDLSGMKVWVDYSEEWKQIFYESWRQMRDFFYDPGMHGTDWPALRDKYAALLPYVGHRDDLTYIIGEMISELSIGHTYVLSGDKPKAERISTGLLGAKLSRQAEGYYRIDRILEGANWSKELRSPLTEVGVNVKEGDYIITVNGNAAKDMDDIYASLVGYADKQVELTVNSKPDAAGSRKVIVVPLADESGLYYYNWVQGNTRKVAEATNNQVGYIHIPDMSTEGLNEFIKHFYPQLMKKGLIIDDRGNGGGNVSPMIIERLRREMVLTGMARNQTLGTPNPDGTFAGPKVCLIDNYSASDGDLFPFRFKEMKLGKLIGVRTWGGVVGIRGPLPLMDGGQLYKPEFASYSKDGKSWPIEGHGVEPDIEVDNDPAREYAGEDAQLNKAIEVILEEMKDYPDYVKPIPPFPVKNK